MPQYLWIGRWEKYFTRPTVFYQQTSIRMYFSGLCSISIPRWSKRQKYMGRWVYSSRHTVYSKALTLRCTFRSYKCAVQGACRTDAGCKKGLQNDMSRYMIENWQNCLFHDRLFQRTICSLEGRRNIRIFLASCLVTHGCLLISVKLTHCTERNNQPNRFQKQRLKTILGSYFVPRRWTKSYRLIMKSMYLQVQSNVLGGNLAHLISKHTRSVVRMCV